MQYEFDIFELIINYKKRIGLYNLGNININKNPHDRFLRAFINSLCRWVGDTNGFAPMAVANLSLMIFWSLPSNEWFDEIGVDTWLIISFSLIIKLHSGLQNRISDESPWYGDLDFRKIKTIKRHILENFLFFTRLILIYDKYFTRNSDVKDEVKNKNKCHPFCTERKRVLLSLIVQSEQYLKIN